MHKVGDKFEVVVARISDDLVAVGDIVTYISGVTNYGGYFSTKDNKEFVAEFEGANAFVSRVVRPYRTEAEKRGAKFGVTGVVESTGEKCIYLNDTPITPSHWDVVIEWQFGNFSFEPSGIRLDHEPKYKEIPFSEATHEQRMDADNLIIDGGFGVSEIMKFDMAGYVYTLRGSAKVCTNTGILTVRIPA